MSDLPGDLPPQNYQHQPDGTRPPHQSGPAVTHVEVSTPLWRVIAVIAFSGAIAALAYYLNAIHHADDAATIAVITAAYTISFWARKRPDQLTRRFGPFGKIAAAIRESQDDLQRWVHSKPLRAGALIAVGYGVAVVIAKHAVITVIHAMWSPWLAVAIGAGVGAIVAAPRMFTDLARRLAGKTSNLDRHNP